MRIPVRQSFFPLKKKKIQSTEYFQSSHFYIVLFDFIKMDPWFAFVFAVMHPLSSLYFPSHQYCYSSGAFLVFKEGVQFGRSWLEWENMRKENDVQHLHSINRQLSNFISKICIQNVSNGLQQQWKAALWEIAQQETYLPSFK